MSSMYIDVKENAEKARRRFEALKKTFVDLSDVVKASKSGFEAMTSKVSGLVKKLGSIAKLRILRGIVKSISAALSEGIQNVYRYSDAMGLAFANTMDSLATSYQYLKNTVGTAMAQLISAIAPTLTTIINLAAKAFDALAQLFALLGGKSTYSKALVTATKYSGALASDVGSAAGSAKELQRTLLGIDEINRLNDDSSSGGGGGGGGSSTPDYSSMFTESPISETMKKFADELDRLKVVIGEIGAGFLAWKFTKGFINTLSMLKGWDAATTAAKLATAAKVIGGITLGVTGFTIEAISGYSLGYNGPSLEALVKSAVGSALGIAGSVITVTALGGTAGIGIAIGAGLSILVGGVSFIVGSYQQAKEQSAEMHELLMATDEDYQKLVANFDETQEIMARSAGYLDELNVSLQNFDVIVGKAATAKTLVNQIYDIYEKSNKSNDEIKKMQDLIGQLNDLGFDGLNIQYDNLTDTMNMSRDSAMKLTDQIIEQAKQEAMIEILKDAYVAEMKAEMDAERISQILTQAKKDQEEALSHLNTEEYMAHALTGQLTDAEKEWARKNDEAAATIRECEKAQKGINDTLDEAHTATTNITSAIDAYNRKGVVDKGSAFSSIYSSASLAASAIFDVVASVDRYNNIHITGGRVMYAKGGVVGYANGGIIPGFASGGLHSAQLFMANENAAPELIGNIGQKTAVANTSQMVEAMSIGVYQANAEQNELLREQNGYLRELCAKDTGGISVNDITNALARQNRITGRTIVSVG